MKNRRQESSIFVTMRHLPMIAMNPEQFRHERFTTYAAALQERFEAGMLSELQELPQWVVWRAELEQENVQYLI